MTTNYTHADIREFMTNDANGTICEAALIAVKNLESAIYKRKSVNSVEREAVLMLIQCADELREHITDKPIEEKVHLPLALREGLKREIVDAMVQRSPSRFTRYEEFGTIADNHGIYWGFNPDSDRLVRIW